MSAMKNLSIDDLAADASITLRQSRFLQLPGEIRNRIYDFAFGSKTLHIVSQSPERIEPARSSIFTNCCWQLVPKQEKSGLYAIRQTCQQVAKETEYYLFNTLEFSRKDSNAYDFLSSHPVASEYAAFKQMLHGRWKHVRRLIIQSFHMGPMVAQCEQYLPRFPLPGVTLESYGFYDRDKIFWPADARNLTALTIHDMHRRTACEREELLKVMKFYFPKLEDVRCSYYGDLGCMRRYRIVGNELKWWYTGDVFKQLPEEPTQEQWIGSR